MLAYAAYVAFLALLAVARAQDDSLRVEVNPQDLGDEETSYTSDLTADLKAARNDALLLYTEYQGQSGNELKMFLGEMAGFTDRALKSVEPWTLAHAPESCRNEFQESLKKAESNARLAGSLSGLNHHKYFLGHMVVFRMHLNKSEEFIKKCDKVLKKCGARCESTPRIRRWRRYATDELKRVRDDLKHSRRSYHDIVTHAHKKLLHLRKEYAGKAKEITDQFIACVAKTQAGIDPRS